jgi:hypothetical protein
MKAWKVVALVIIAFICGVLYEGATDTTSFNDGINNIISEITDSCVNIHYFVVNGKTYECYIDKDI